MEKCVVIEKKTGETPLQALERYKHVHPELINAPAVTEDFWMQMSWLQGLWRRSSMSKYGEEPKVPKTGQMRQKYPSMAYAGRLDPMASGKLLVLIGEECKRQTEYHSLDKAYQLDVLFGVSSDTGDVLGRLEFVDDVPEPTEGALKNVAKSFSGTAQKLPYPHFSSKTVAGKPLHVWTLENRLDEIEIPTIDVQIHTLTYNGSKQYTGLELASAAKTKIDLIPPVTEVSKALGNDFRRTDIHQDWSTFREFHSADTYTVASFTCICSSGTYMRTLASLIAKELGTTALAHHIHRTEIGVYQPLPLFSGFWKKRYR